MIHFIFRFHAENEMNLQWIYGFKKRNKIQSLSDGNIEKKKIQKNNAVFHGFGVSTDSEMR